MTDFEIGFLYGAGLAFSLCLVIWGVYNLWLDHLDRQEEDFYPIPVILPEDRPAPRHAYDPEAGPMPREMLEVRRAPDAAPPDVF